MIRSCMTSQKEVTSERFECWWSLNLKESTKGTDHADESVLYVRLDWCNHSYITALATSEAI